jgi:hypothetical protein
MTVGWTLMSVFLSNDGREHWLLIQYKILSTVSISEFSVLKLI